MTSSSKMWVAGLGLLVVIAVVVGMMIFSDPGESTVPGDDAAVADREASAEISAIEPIEKLPRREKALW